MAKKLSYTDALQILGADDPAALDFAGRLIEGGLGLLGVPDLLGVREMVLEHGRDALVRLRGRIDGTSRHDRSERIAAAHQVIVVTAFFEAVGEVLASPGCPLSLADLEITPEEQHGLFSSTLTSWSVRPPIGLRTERIARIYTSRAELLLRFLHGLAAWERLGDGERRTVGELIRTQVPALAERRYWESYHALAADVAEFGVWVAATEHATTRADIDRLAVGLAGLEEMVGRLPSGNSAERHRAELTEIYRRVLRRPLLSSHDVPAGLRLPTMEEAYLAPRGRLGFTSGESRPSSLSWWEGAEVHEDLQPLLVSLLTQPDATDGPLVVLGHPGAGKSKLTEMLAARLPLGAFLPIRVELRAVQADAPIRRQIEEGMAAVLHTDVAWRDLADSAGDALPVVILDGFDELLQATGVNRSDYLERVQEFQRDQSALGRPIAVIVTSRTVVADRVRFPESTPVILLEPFDEGRISRMLDVWSGLNADELLSRGLRPLTLDIVLAHRELAEQPLLLMMLMIYDADGNALRNATAGLSRAGLYQQLLSSFAEREVRKHRPHLDAPGLRRAIDDELRRLEVVAMAMFARRGQTVTAEELGADLAVLFPDSGTHTGDPGLHGRIDDADQVLGRFFFVHEARALQDGGARSVYEFLHATFGEFLVARMVVEALRELVEERRHARRRRYAEPLNDGLLYAITSFAALPGRSAVLEFADDLLQDWFTRLPEERGECRALLVDLFREAPFPSPHRSFSDYAPRRIPITQRQALHSTNLVVLLTLVEEGEIDIAELFPDSRDPWQSWRGMSGLWRGMTAAEWHGTIDAIRVRHLGYLGDRPRSMVQRGRPEPVNVGECIGFELRADVTGPLAVADPYSIVVPYDGVTSKLLRSMALRANGTASRMVLMLLPYLFHAGEDLGTWFVDPIDPDLAWAETYDVLELRLGRPRADAPGRLERYTRLLSSPTLGRVELIVLRQAAEDLALTSDAVPERAALVRVVESFLHDVRSARGITTADVRSAMDALRPFLRHGETADTVLGRVITDAMEPLDAPPSDDVPGRPVAPGRAALYPGGSGGSAG
ncbi:hypothetical protein GCM10027294_42950 [Marinactinospora endophytica]